MFDNLSARTCYYQNSYLLFAVVKHQDEQNGAEVLFGKTVWAVLFMFYEIKQSLVVFGLEAGRVRW
jgi:hypothetical protein